MRKPRMTVTARAAMTAPFSLIPPYPGSERPEAPDHESGPEGKCMDRFLPACGFGKTCGLSELGSTRRVLPPAHPPPHSPPHQHTVDGRVHQHQGSEDRC